MHSLPDIPDNTDVWVTVADRPTQGYVVSSSEAPRSYTVRTSSGTVRQNRHHLRVLTSSSAPTTQPVGIEPTRRIMTRQQTWTEIHPPN